ncbi:MAG: hypothetical protein A2085_01890 [Gemmatimonadetes bacterium GWC2_71_10]|nr:MAG: hypothetical protein A2085_01890 [Gemmatimonadetes bacterium GWC2_71_10]
MRGNSVPRMRSEIASEPPSGVLVPRATPTTSGSARNRASMAASAAGLTGTGRAKVPPLTLTVTSRSRAYPMSTLRAAMKER